MKFIKGNKTKWNVNRKIPLRTYIDMLDNREPFSFVRYGDGEWLTILGAYGRKNSNGCTFTPELSADLRAVLARNHNYQHATLRIAKNNWGDMIRQFINDTDCKVEWYHGDIFLDSSLKGNLFQFVEQLRKRRVLCVGQNYLRGLHNRFFNLVGIVVPPKNNAHAQKRILLPKIESEILRTKADTVIWSCGLHTNVFVDELWPKFGDKVTMIDCGSMWDGYFSIRSRSYIRRGRIDWKSLEEVNAGKRKKKVGETFRYQ